MSKHAASRSSGWTATRRRKISKSDRRCSTKAGVKRLTACFSGMGGMMAPARLPVEALVEPEEVGIAAEDGGIGGVLEDGLGEVATATASATDATAGAYLFGGTHVDAVGGELRHAVLVLDRVGYGNVRRGVLGPGGERNRRRGEGRRLHRLHRLLHRSLLHRRLLLLLRGGLGGQRSRRLGWCLLRLRRLRLLLNRSSSFGGGHHVSRLRHSCHSFRAFVSTVRGRPLSRQYYPTVSIAAAAWLGRSISTCSTFDDTRREGRDRDRHGRLSAGSCQHAPNEQQGQQRAHRVRPSEALPLGLWSRVENACNCKCVAAQRSIA